MFFIEAKDADGHWFRLSSFAPYDTHEEAERVIARALVTHDDAGNTIDYRVVSDAAPALVTDVEDEDEDDDEDDEDEDDLDFDDETDPGLAVPVQTTVQTKSDVAADDVLSEAEKARFQDALKNG